MHYSLYIGLSSWIYGANWRTPPKQLSRFALITLEVKVPWHYALLTFRNLMLSLRILSHDLGH